MMQLKWILALGLLGVASTSLAAEPLLMEGKSTLYQRVLTTPSCVHGGP